MTDLRTGGGIAPTAFLMGDPDRAAMLAALLGGQALTAVELAAEAGITAPTANGHLARSPRAALSPSSARAGTATCASHRPRSPRRWRG